MSGWSDRIDYPELAPGWVRLSKLRDQAQRSGRVVDHMVRACRNGHSCTPGRPTHHTCCLRSACARASLLRLLLLSQSHGHFYPRALIPVSPYFVLHSMWRPTGKSSGL